MLGSSSSEISTTHVRHEAPNDVDGAVERPNIDGPVNETDAGVNAETIVVFRPDSASQSSGADEAASDIGSNRDNESLEIRLDDADGISDDDTDMDDTPAATPSPSPEPRKLQAEDNEDSDVGRSPRPVTEVALARKLPGRRRAPHAVPKIEAAIRRQLHLRMHFRAVAKSLKPILAELSRRSIQELSEHDRAHEQYPAHVNMGADLKRRLDERLALITRTLELDQEKLREVYEQSAEYRRLEHKVSASRKSFGVMH